MKGFVGAIVFIEDCGRSVMGVSEVGDLRDQRDRWYGRLGVRVNRSNKRLGRECCVHGGGDSELQ